MWSYSSNNLYVSMVFSPSQMEEFFWEFVLDPGRRSQYSDWAVGWTAE